MRMLYRKLKVYIESIYTYLYRKKFELCSIKITCFYYNFGFINFSYNLFSCSVVGSYKCIIIIAS